MAGIWWRNATELLDLVPPYTSVDING